MHIHPYTFPYNQVSNPLLKLWDPMSVPKSNGRFENLKMRCIRDVFISFLLFLYIYIYIYIYIYKAIRIR